MGCGRVGSTLAHILEDRGNTVAVIDRDPEAFRRLRPSFKGDRVTGIGFDRDVLARAGIERADGFAAVSSGDNSNIIAARVARETFAVSQVAARIYDPRRAEVYERLGIPTVATVRWTADQMLRKLLPESTEPLWRDATGKVVLSQVAVCPDWIGEPVKMVEASVATRIVYIDRLGEAIVPLPATVLQHGDVVHVIARELLENGHEVLLIDQKPSAIKVDSVPRAEWLLADACEISSLDDAALDRCNVVVAATGDDKVNLVVSLLAKTEYGVPRVVARVNHPGNEWLYNESWGIDVAVSTPRLLSALVEEAVSVGDLVRLMSFGQSEASLVELTMPADAPLAGKQVGSIEWPADVALVAILREGRVLVPQSQDPLQPGDELFFVTSQDVEQELEDLFAAE